MAKTDVTEGSLADVLSRLDAIEESLKAVTESIKTLQTAQAQVTQDNGTFQSEVRVMLDTTRGVESSALNELALKVSKLESSNAAIKGAFGA